VLSDFVFPLDRDVAAHLLLAVRRHREHLRRLGAAEPPALSEVEAALLAVVGERQGASGGVRERQGATGSDSRRVMAESQDHDDEFLTRFEVARRVGVSVRTVDRWIAAGELWSAKRGRVRRVARADLDRFLSAAA
jgi:excisionase family DNA binding protein